MTTDDAQSTQDKQGTQEKQSPSHSPSRRSLLGWGGAGLAL
ncbi:hypothetical protein GA0115259_109721, partial [Streptomyces sp. MnatMP-M17]